MTTALDLYPALENLLRGGVKNVDPDELVSDLSSFLGGVETGLRRLLETGMPEQREVAQILLPKISASKRALNNCS
ncbi:hypothetical protein ACFL11_01420 [Patescibacteria group bacterium]